MPTHTQSSFFTPRASLPLWTRAVDEQRQPPRQERTGGEGKEERPGERAQVHAGPDGCEPRPREPPHERVGGGYGEARGRGEEHG